jgi:hypothetical protein
MKLYLISQETNNDWDTYDSAVVAAPNENIARNINPNNGRVMKTPLDWEILHYSWCSAPKFVKVEYLGEAVAGMKQGVICSSFNAG